MVDTISGISDERQYPDFGVVVTLTETFRNNMKLIAKFDEQSLSGFTSIVSESLKVCRQPISQV